MNSLGRMQQSAYLSDRNGCLGMREGIDLPTFVRE